MINLIKSVLRTAEKTVERLDTIIDKTGESLEIVVTTSCDFVNLECQDILSDRAKERSKALKAAKKPAAKK